MIYDEYVNQLKALTIAERVEVLALAADAQGNAAMATHLRNFVATLIAEDGWEMISPWEMKLAAGEAQRNSATTRDASQ